MKQTLQYRPVYFNAEKLYASPRCTYGALVYYRQPSIFR